MRFAFCSLIGVASLGLLAACNDSPSVTETPSLMTPLTITSTGEMSKSSVSVHVENYLFGQVDDVRIPLHGITFSARLGTETFAIDQLTLELGDIDISPAAMPPAGLRLRQVALALLPPDGGASFAGNMFGHKETRVDVAATLPFQIQWKLELADGTLFDLGPGVMAPLDFIFSITPPTTASDADAKLTLVATCEGACWEMPKTLGFENAAITVEAPLLLDAIEPGAGK